MPQPISISVTVPVHNTESYLPTCLDSLLAQTYPHLEIVCVDDGSTDASLHILQEYAAKDKRIKVYHQEAAGVSAARNTALLHSTGDFVTSLDSDDFLAPDTYEKAVACITDEVDWVSYGIQLVDTDGNPLPDYDGYYATHYEGTLDFTPGMASKMNVCIWAKLWRRSIMVEHNMLYPHGLVHEDDAIFYMFAPFVRKAAFIKDICYYYVQRRGSIMHEDRKTIADAEQYLGILRYVFDFHTKQKLNPLHNDFFLCQFGRAYHLVERFCPEHQRHQLAAMFKALAQETGLDTAHPRDWRIRCLNLPGKLLSFFIRRRSRRTQYRLGALPLFSITHNAEGMASYQFDLLSNILLRLRNL